MKTFIHHTAIIYEGVEIGLGCYIGPYCVIGAPAEKVGCFDSMGKVVIGSGVRLEKQVTIDSGTERMTIIGPGCHLLKNAHVGHDAVLVGDNTLACNVCIGGFTEVGHGTNFGLGAVTHQRLVIPSGCMIGMNATITKTTKMREGYKYYGVPAREHGPNIRG